VQEEGPSSEEEKPRPEEASQDSGERVPAAPAWLEEVVELVALTQAMQGKAELPTRLLQDALAETQRACLDDRWVVVGGLQKGPTEQGMRQMTEQLAGLRERCSKLEEATKVRSCTLSS